jgi:hypothetical protein
LLVLALVAVALRFHFGSGTPPPREIVEAVRAGEVETATAVQPALDAAPAAAPASEVEEHRPIVPAPPTNVRIDALDRLQRRSPGDGRRIGWPFSPGSTTSN